MWLFISNKEVNFYVKLRNQFPSFISLLSIRNAFFKLIEELFNTNVW